jgi:ribosomal protein S18 acetylase RimI-like enzyme
MGESVTLRPARPRDAGKAAELIYSTGPASFNLVFGSRDKAVSIIRRMFAKPDTIMSFTHTTVAEFQGRTVGVLVLLDRKAERQTQVQSGAELLRIVGPLFLLFRLPIYLRQGRLTEAIPPETLFIADVAVSPSLRGRGIGRLLMEHACRVARREGYPALSLDVTRDNLSAIGFYHRLGYVRTLERTDTWLAHRYGLSGFLRMTKPV